MYYALIIKILDDSYKVEIHEKIVNSLNENQLSFATDNEAFYIFKGTDKAMVNNFQMAIWSYFDTLPNGIFQYLLTPRLDNLDFGGAFEKKLWDDIELMKA